MKKHTPDEKIIKKLKCPLCASEMSLAGEGASLVCEGVRKHCYDISAKGYVNLLPPGKTQSGDSREAVRARKDFLSLEYYSTAAKALADTLEKYLTRGDTVIDAGCGEGYYTAEIAERGFSVAGVDISKHAAEFAAKRCYAKDLNGFFAVGSVFALPFADESADCVVNIFAPCAEGEFSRVLKKGGILAVVYAGPEHLMGLKRVIYDNVTKNDERADMPTDMTLAEEIAVTFDISVEGNESVKNLFSMTPYYWRTSQEDSKKLDKIERLDTTVDMRIAVYRRD